MVRLNIILPDDFGKELKKVSFLLLSVFVFLSYSTAYALSKEDVDSPFGFTTSFYAPERSSNEKMLKKRKNFEFDGLPADTPPYSTALELGVKWERLSNPVLDWSFVQRDKESIVNGRYNWEIPDNFIKRVPAGLNLVITINANPMLLRQGGWEFITPQAKEAYIEFVKRAVERYDGDGQYDMPGLKSPVKYWQVENEPEVRVKKNRTRVRRARADFEGVRIANSEADQWRAYAEFIEITSSAVKSSDKDAKVLSGGIVSPPPQMRLELLNDFWIPIIRILSKDAIDIFDFHWFDESIVESRSIFMMLRDALNESGLGHVEIWITETGSSSKESERDQAIQVVKRYIFPLGYGVKKVFWAWALVEGWPPFDCRSMFDYTGLIYDGYCPGDPGYGIRKLAFYTYKQMTEKFKSSRLSGISVISGGEDGVYAYMFPREDKAVYIIWGEEGLNGKSFELKAAKDSAYILTEAIPNVKEGRYLTHASEDIFNTRILVSSGDRLSVEVSSIPVYVEGPKAEGR